MTAENEPMSAENEETTEETTPATESTETTEATEGTEMTEAQATDTADAPEATESTEATAAMDTAGAPEATDAPEATEAADAPEAAAAPEAARKSGRAAKPKADDAPATDAQQTPARKAPPKRGYHAGEWTGLRARYREEVVPALQKEFGYVNPNQVPRLTKIVVNIGLGEALTNAKALDAAVGDLASITGQKPIVTRARRSIAQFRLRTGNPIGAKVTLRDQRMWDFLERLTRLALPRIRDFRGVPTKSFDGRGNYSLGLREQLAFPEIDYDKIDRLRGLEVSIVTTAETDEESKRLLQLLGMPFAS